MTEKMHTQTSKTSFLGWLRNWSMASLPWPFYVGSSCCGAEFLSLYSDRFQGELPFPVLRPEESDLLLIAGNISHKYLPQLIESYNSMLEPKHVILIGNCAIDGGPYKNYNVVQNIEDYIKVDFKIFGCPPSPSAIINCLEGLKETIIDGN